VLVSGAKPGEPPNCCLVVPTHSTRKPAPQRCPPGTREGGTSRANPNALVFTRPYTRENKLLTLWFKHIFSRISRDLVTHSRQPLPCTSFTQAARAGTQFKQAALLMISARPLHRMQEACATARSNSMANLLLKRQRTMLTTGRWPNCGSGGLNDPFAISSMRPWHIWQYRRTSSGMRDNTFCSAPPLL
jgi:hypothetical protein